MLGSWSASSFGYKHLRKKEPGRSRSKPQASGGSTFSTGFVWMK
jgi:hypothetical protein